MDVSKCISIAGNHTNNYVESNFNILKSDVLQRSRAFNPTHLLAIIASNYEKMVYQKLLEVGNGYKPLSKYWAAVKSVGTLASSEAVKVGSS